METLYHHIRSQFQRRNRESRLPSKGEMRPVSLIHNQRNPPLMDDFRNCVDIRDNTVIRGRYHQHSLRLRMGYQQPPHILR